jgi:WD40 repeat protein
MLLASSSRDGTVRVWNVRDGTELACLKGHRGPVLSVAVSGDSERIVTGGSDKTVRVWQWQTGNNLFTGQLDGVGGLELQAHSPMGPAGPQLSLEVAFLAGNSIAARVGRDHIVTWDFNSAKLLQVIPWKGTLEEFSRDARAYAFVEGNEVCIARASGEEIAWHPCVDGSNRELSLTPHPRDSAWIAIGNREIEHLSLEFV